MVHSRDFLDAPSRQKEAREEIKNTISNPNFVSNLKKAVFILKEIERLTTKFQGDNVPISEVYADFQNIPFYYKSDEAKEFLSKQEVVFIEKAIKVNK